MSRPVVFPFFTYGARSRGFRVRSPDVGRVRGSFEELPRRAALGAGGGAGERGEHHRRLRGVPAHAEPLQAPRPGDLFGGAPLKVLGELHEFLGGTPLGFLGELHWGFEGNSTGV